MWSWNHAFSDVGFTGRFFASTALCEIRGSSLFPRTAGGNKAAIQRVLGNGCSAIEDL